MASADGQGGEAGRPEVESYVLRIILRNILVLSSGLSSGHAKLRPRLKGSGRQRPHWWVELLLANSYARAADSPSPSKREVMPVLPPTSPKEKKKTTKSNDRLQ
jgi:hypothetical protein